jgi:hypothetical protein
LAASAADDYQVISAAGGTAKAFHAVVDGSSAREAPRIGRKQAAKLPSQDDYARSERATYICWHNWLSHSHDPAKRAQAKLMREAASSMSIRMESKERASFTAQQLAEIRQEFERLSGRWSSLAVGESFTEPW